MREIASEQEIFEEVSNPLDFVEEVFCAQDWVFERMGDNELTVQITGKMGEYKLFFDWQEDYSAMRFVCVYDLDIKREAVDLAAKTMTTVNSSLWLGHFAFRENTAIPCFRHTTLFRGMTQTSGAEHIEDLVEIALAECERHYAVFDILSRGLPMNGMDLNFAMMPVVGES